MKNFELWLDESGDFNNDLQKAEKGANPSLVGGLLIEKGTFPDSCINAILPEEGTYHSVNENDQLGRFKLIVERLFKNEANRFVVFSNQECIMILDNNLTYLNIISEGILQLMKYLKAQYGEIFLNVIIANRVDTTTGLNPGQSIVPPGEYVKRLKEKLLVASLENSISDKEWEIQTASARKDKRLMLADIICNTYFTRCRKKKFNKDERAYIENLYANEKNTLIFTVFESVLEKNFRNNLIENRIGEAVSCICLSTDREAVKRCFGLLKLHFSACGLHDILFQYKFVEAYIEYYINVVRDFDLCINFLQNLIEYYIPLLAEYDKSRTKDLAAKLGLDIKFYMLTVYTHLGNVRMSDKMESECGEAIKKLPVSLETVNYSIKFETRKISNLINSFKFETALEYADEQVKKCQGIKELLCLVSDEGSGHYDELAKALGTRLQIKTFMLREKEDIYASGVKDSEQAIEEFLDEENKMRQYLYRSQLETEHREYGKALKFLKKSVALEDECDFKELWAAVEKKSSFAVNAYIRLMAEGAGNWSLSTEMYKAMSTGGYIQKLDSQPRFFHPSEIILWKFARYCSVSGMGKAAVKYYDKAVDACFSSDDITLNVIGLGIDFEEHAMLLKSQKKEALSHNKQMEKRWKKVRGNDNKDILGNVFGKVDFRQTEPDYYEALGRKITY